MSSRSAYSHLLSPGRIGPIALRNRIVLAPMIGRDGPRSSRTPPLSPIITSALGPESASRNSSPSTKVSHPLQAASG